MCPRAQEPRKARRSADGRAQPVVRLRERTSTRRACGIRATPPNHPLILKLRHPRLPYPGKMRIKKRPEAHPRKNTDVSADLLRKWPQVPARRFCPTRAIGLLACLHPRTAPSRNTEYSGGIPRLRQAYSGGPAPDFNRLPEHRAHLDIKINKSNISTNN